MESNRGAFTMPRSSSLTRPGRPWVWQSKGRHFAGAMVDPCPADISARPTMPSVYTPVVAASARGLLRRVHHVLHRGAQVAFASIHSAAFWRHGSLAA